MILDKKVRIRLPAPPESDDDPECYGVIMSGSHMEPSLSEDDVLWVFPSYSLNTNRNVLIAPKDAKTNGLRYVLRFIRDTGTHWIARQFNPPLEHILPQKEWPTCHAIGVVSGPK
jgi:hypothetical protein